MRKSLLGIEHPDYANALFNLGLALTSAKHFDEAEVVLREALALFRKTVGDRHRRTAACLDWLGEIMRATGRLSEAESAYRGALASWKGRMPPFGLIAVLRAQGKLGEAEAVLSEVTAESRARVEKAREQPPSEEGVGARLWLAASLWRQAQVAETESLLEEAIATARKLPPSAALSDGISCAAMRIATLQAWCGREAERASLCRLMLGWAGDEPGCAAKGRAAQIASLRSLADPELHARALTLARQALQAAPTNALLSCCQMGLGLAQYRCGLFVEAQQTLTAPEQGGTNLWHSNARTGTSRFYRAMILCRQGQRAAALQLFSETEAKMPPVPANVQWALAEGEDYENLMLWLAYREARDMLNGR